MQLIASKVFIIFIYIGIGFVANKLKVLTSESQSHLIALVLNITTPCLMVSAICSKQIDDSMIFNTIFILIVTMLYFLLMALLTMRYCRRLKLEDPMDGNILSVAMCTCNSGFMGFPIAKSVFGGEVFYYLVIQNLAFNLYLFTVSVMQLNYGDSNSTKKLTRADLLKPFKSLVTIVALVSVVLLFAGIKIPDYPMDIITEIGDITIPVSMMIVGIQLGDCSIKEVLGNINLLKVNLFKLFLFPVFVLAIVWFMPVSNIVKLTLVLGVTFPSAVLSVAMAANENRNTKLMAQAVASTTLFSMITLPLWLMALTKLFM